MTEQAQAIFDANVLGTLATINSDGSPWSTPVHVATDGTHVYWFSKETTQHSMNIADDNRVSLTLFSPDESKGPKGVYVNGKAKLLAGEQADEARAVFTSRLGVLPPIFQVASAYQLPVGVLREEKSTSNCWYFYS